MPDMIDLAGKRFGDLVAMEPCGKKNGRYVWKCLCDCGNYAFYTVSRLRGGMVTSCGCKSQRTLTIKHGQRHTRLYGIWCDMKRRCNNPKNKRYARYGGRGIKVCKEWEADFQPFYDWAVSSGYKDDLTIERKDVDAGYSPENCRWVTWDEQALNRSTNIYIEHEGQIKILAEWCRIYDFPYHSAKQRYKSIKENGKEIDFDKLFYRGNLISRKVDQLTLEGEFIRTWDSMTEIAKHGYDRSGVSSCCNGKHKTANGYKWGYSKG